MKLKKILKESNAPGYKDRKFGESLPTLASVQAAYEAKQAGKKESLKEELSKPAAEPMKHSPEESKTEMKFKFAGNRRKSTLDRVMETIINK